MYTTLPQIPTLNLDELERIAIGRALTQTGGNRVRAAALLGIHVRTLHRKLREQAIEAATKAGYQDAAEPAERALAAV